jgi:hypothetical protein
VHEIAADGMACSDGNICTEQDRCIQGICGGDPRASEAEVLGSLYGYGGYREDHLGIRGSSLVLSPDRVVFLDAYGGGSRLSLVKIDSQGQLVLLDQMPTKQVLSSTSVSIWLGHSVPVFALVALEAKRFVLAGAGLPKYYQAQVYDVVDDRLVERSSVTRLVGGTSFTTAGQGDRFWSQTVSGLEEYLVASDGSISKGRSHQAVGEYGGLQAALSVDGSVLYQAQLLGIDRWDLSTEPPSKLPGLWPGRSFISLDVTAGHIATQEVSQQLGSNVLAGIQVYRTGDFSPVASFPADDTHQPIAFKLVDGGILIEWEILDGPIRRLVSKVYRLSGDEPELQSEHLIWEDCCNSVRSIPPMRLSSAGSLVVLAPWQRVVRIEANGAQRELTGPGHGGLTQVDRIGSTLATAFDPYSSQVIDLSNPRTPKYRSGGYFEARQTHPVQLYRNHAEAEMLVLTSDASRATSGVAPSSQISLLESTTSEGAKPAGSIALSGDPGLVAIRGNSLYQVVQEGDAGYRLRRYVYPFPSGTKDVAPVWEQVLAIEPDGATKKRTPAVALDPFGAGGIIAAVRENSGGVRLHLLWFEEMEAGVTLRGLVTKELSDTGYLRNIAVARGKALLLAGDQVLTMSLRDSAFGSWGSKRIEPDASVTSQFGPETLLHFDGKRVMFRGTFFDSSAAVPRTDTDVFDVDTWEIIASYRLESFATTLTEMNGNWLVGSDDAAHVLAPACQRPASMASVPANPSEQDVRPN